MKDFRQFAQFPFGGVYYRVSNPPREDWERDYAQAARDGMNTFRHWFLWSSIEREPGVFFWEPYDRQLELGAKYGIKAVIAEITHSAPQWAYAAHPEAVYRDEHGHPFQPVMMESTGTGGYYGLCLDNDSALELAGRWLTELAAHYRDHPGLGAFDVFNESNLFSCQPEYCHCDATKAKFRDWLKAKYGEDVRALSEAWRRHGYTEWSQVEPPVLAGPYPDFMDWVRFRADNMYRLIQWRIDCIKRGNPNAVIAGHVTDDCSLYRYVDAADDAWRSADLFEISGYTGGNGNSPDKWKWQRWLHADLTRSGARGKPFWACELTAGPNFKALTGGSRQERVPTPGQVRSSEFAAMAAGARGILNCRWRPLQNGPLFGAFGYYGLDGRPTNRSDTAARTAKWANDPAQADLMASRPIAGEVGILFDPETEILLTLLYGTRHQHTNTMGPENLRIDPAVRKPLQDYATGIDSTYYANSVRGIYQALMDMNVQPDFVKSEDLFDYALVYVPCPVMLSETTIDRLLKYVERGGCVICEGAPGLFDETGFVGDKQPPAPLHTLFGAVQDYAEFFPDLLEESLETFSLDGVGGVPAGLYVVTYVADGGNPVGHYECLEGACAVENRFGSGKTMLLGTSLGMGYWQHCSAATRKLLERLLGWAGIEPRIQTNSDEIMARLHKDGSKLFLWVVNNTLSDVHASIRLSEALGNLSGARVNWGNAFVLSGNALEVTIEKQDAFVAELIVESE